MKKILIIPASGIGSRMNHNIPKQYIKLNNGLTILDYTISQLLCEDFFDLVIVTLSSNDFNWKNSIHTTNVLIKTCIGGFERSLKRWFLNFYLLIQRYILNIIELIIQKKRMK